MGVKKRYIQFIVVVIIIIAIYFIFFNKPDYQNIYTPKPVLGNENANVLIEEFSDLQCSACRAAHPVVKQMIEEYGDDVKLEFRHFPLMSKHPEALITAQAAECANDQGMFWEYVEISYNNQDKLQEKYLKYYAQALGLDTKSFNACLDSGAKKKQVLSEQREGTARAVQGTPTFFINGKKLESWAYGNFKQEIEAEI